MEVETLVGWLRENGWKYRLSKGSITIADPCVGTETEYSLSVIGRNTLENILPPHFPERWQNAGDKWEHLDTTGLHL